MKFIKIILLPLLLLGCATPLPPVSVLGEGDTELVYSDLAEQLEVLYPKGSTLFIIGYAKPEIPTPLESGIGSYLRLQGFACQDSTESEPLERGDKALTHIQLSFNQVHGEDSDIVSVSVGKDRKLILAYSTGSSGAPVLIGITKEELPENSGMNRANRQ